MTANRLPAVRTTKDPREVSEATILIATRDRKDELRRALESALRQEGAPEILVMDDGSTDGTDEMVREEFPGVRLVRSGRSRGQCVQRNIGTALARGRVVIGIDDDACFASPATVRQTVADFEADRVGIVAIPFQDHRAVGSWLEQAPPDRDRCWVASTFVAAAYAVRREEFLACGGFRESLFRAGEEGDLSLRMLAAGLVTRLGTADPLEHHESPQRVRADILRLEARNEVLLAWFLVPSAFLPVRMLKVAANHVLLGLRRRMPGASIRGIAEGFAACLTLRASRTPVPVPTYRLYRHLRREGPATSNDVLGQLGPIDPSEAARRTESPSAP